MRDDSGLVREVIARALRENVTAEYLGKAGAVVAALQQHGYVIVPAQQFVDLAAAADGRPLAAAVAAERQRILDGLESIRTAAGRIEQDTASPTWSAVLDGVVRLVTADTTGGHRMTDAHHHYAATGNQSHSGDGASCDADACQWALDAGIVVPCPACANNDAQEAVRLVTADTSKDGP